MPCGAAFNTSDDTTTAVGLSIQVFIHHYRLPPEPLILIQLFIASPYPYIRFRNIGFFKFDPLRLPQQY